MKEFLEIVSEEMKQAFEKAGYPAEYGKVNVSNRPDLCELQCNGAMALAKQFKKAPIMMLLLTARYFPRLRLLCRAF